MNQTDSALLARTPCGHVKQCASGCIHLTFDNVTLHFPGDDEFEAMAQAVAIEADTLGEDEAFDLHHGWLAISLSARGAREFVRLVLEALSNLTWRRGDYEFTDHDLAEIRSRCML